MSGSSGFKVVGIVMVLSITAVVVIGRLIDNGAFSSLSALSPFRSKEVAGESDSKPPVKVEERGRRAMAKLSKSTAVAREPITAEGVPGEHRIEAKYESPQRISLGMDRSQLLTSFGNPTLRVIETNEGHVIERFIYIDAERRTRTVAVLQNGRAIRSYTGPYFGVKPIKADR